MEAMAVYLDDDASRAPEKVDEEPTDANVHLWIRQPVTPDQLHEHELELALRALCEPGVVADR